MAKIDVDRELQKAQAELLPLERKLIAWSLGIGFVLLALLALLNQYMPIGA
jgi:TRAP-type C4-dicarboxylate transport system permease small subunit